MTFFVTGGAGFLGINLVRHLLARGHKVIIYDLAPFDYPEKGKVGAVVGDIRDFEKLKTAMQGADVVVHTAAALPLYKPEDIRSTDIEGTKNVLEAALQSGISRVVHVSSTAVYGIPDHHPLKEEDKLDGVGEYGKAKIAAEALCLEYRKKGLVVPIVRPKSFVGPERLGVFALFYDWAADGKHFPMIGSGHNRYQLLDVEDLCEAIRLCATLPPEQANDTFNIGAKEFMTMREDYQTVLDRAGFDGRVIGLPALPIIWALRLLEALNLSPLYKWVYETASKDSFVSIDKAKRKLGWQPKYSNKEALIRNYEWYLEHRTEFARTSGVSHRVPWKQGILALAKPLFGFPLPAGSTRFGELALSRRFAIALGLVLGFFVGFVLALQVLYSYAYLAADSFTYFAMVRQYWESGLLLSYSGVDHTTGVHLGWYFFLLPFFPLSLMMLPEWSLVLGLFLTLGGVWALWRAFGPAVALTMLLVLTTTWGVRTINNGMESVLAFFFLSLFACACVRYEPILTAPLRGLRTAKAAAFLGVLLGLVAFARLDCALIFMAFGFVFSVRLLFEERNPKAIIAGTLSVLAPLSLGFLVVFLPTLAIFYIYGGSIMPIAGMIKSTFPHFVPLQDVATFRKYPIAVLVLALHLVFLYWRGRGVGLLIPTLFLSTLGLYAYNFFFVVGVGVWYSMLPFFGAVLILGIWLRELPLPSFFVRHFSLTVLAGTTLFVALALFEHVSHPYLVTDADRIAPFPPAAAYLGSVAKEGEAAAETYDGVFAFFSPIPVYSLTGLANNKAYYDAVVEGTLKEYFEERSIKYLVGGEDGVPVPAHAGFQGHGSAPIICDDPIGEAEGVFFHRVEHCFDRP